MMIVCLRGMAMEMNWGNVQNINPIIYFGVIFDLRYKIKFIEWIFEKMYSDDVLIGNDMFIRVKNMLSKLYSWYSIVYGQGKGLLKNPHHKALTDTGHMASSTLVNCAEGRRLTRENRSHYLLLVRETNKTADSTGGKNMGKSTTDIPSSKIEFPSLESQVQVHEVVGENNFVDKKIYEMLLSNLEALFQNTTKQIFEFGYNKDETEKALSRNGLYIGERNPNKRQGYF
ncbi:hypothetical protein L6164_013311 [Bauhinia variegata]|uniref:Uncharacterized protein n=1 Tax=Bauhinia variegata TaxID=167791 RepID=A0ACB9PCP6_BAUVA|nr:hypothetical protein L6164_013311 [Bauhinia variegata]